MFVIISSSRSVSAVKELNVSTGMAIETRFVKAWVSLVDGSGEVYTAWSMSPEDVVPGEIRIGERVG